MARRRERKVPHRIADRPGLKWIHGKGTHRITIGDVEVVICHESGQTVSYTVAPKDVRILVTDLQKVDEA